MSIYRLLLCCEAGTTSIALPFFFFNSIQYFFIKFKRVFKLFYWNFYITILILEIFSGPLLKEKPVPVQGSNICPPNQQSIHQVPTNMQTPATMSTHQPTIQMASQQLQSTVVTAAQSTSHGHTQNQTQSPQVSSTQQSEQAFGKFSL